MRHKAMWNFALKINLMLSVAGGVPMMLKCFADSLGSVEVSLKFSMQYIKLLEKSNKCLMIDINEFI